MDNYENDQISKVGKIEETPEDAKWGDSNGFFFILRQLRIEIIRNSKTREVQNYHDSLRELQSHLLGFYKPSEIELYKKKFIEAQMKINSSETAKNYGIIPHHVKEKQQAIIILDEIKDGQVLILRRARLDVPRKERMLAMEETGD